MAFNRPYRQFIAAILLALYCFIATPVQLWHHHQNVAITDDDDCPVCSHQYSVYNDTPPLEFDVTISLPSSPCGDYLQQLMITPGYSASNKGPPALV